MRRIGFRIVFLYFFCFMFLYGNGNIFMIIPTVGPWLNHWLTLPSRQLTQWLGQHIFHLHGIIAVWHPTGSGDTTLWWVENGLFVSSAILGGLLWTLVAEVRSHRRSEYQTLYAWLRFLLRLTVGFFMLVYGLGKVFPLQMPPLSLAVLNEPVGQMSPMTFLWSFIGSNPRYEIVCGLAEVVGGLLLLYRRTALVGALFSAFVMANVALYNFFFDVGVKLFSTNLLLAILFLVLSDVRPLLDFFWWHKPTAPKGVWIPAATHRGVRIATRVLEWGFSIGFIVSLTFFVGGLWNREQVAAHTSSPLLGAWHLDATHPASGAFLTGDGLPADDFYVDAVNRGFRRSTDGELWRTEMKIDNSAHTMTVFPDDGKPVSYAWQMPDSNHLILTSAAAKSAQGKAQTALNIKPAIVTFTRVPEPAHYPLLERGFHLVNEWGYER